MRYLMTIAYDGSKYYGFQRLNNEKTVQRELEKALSKINKNEVVIKGAGRTDRGVHAKGQCCHFDLDVDIKISVDGNTSINQNGIPYNAPISFKVPRNQADEAKEIVKLVKKHYLFR